MNIAIVLAAGEGTRMKSKRPKVLHKLCGREIIRHVLDSVENSNIDKTILILGHNKTEISESIREYSLIVREQPIGEDKPYGTGYAVMQALDCIEDNSNVLILNGDVPLISSETLNDLIYFCKKNAYAATVISTEIADPKGYGRIIRNENGELSHIIEEKDANENEKKINEINSGIYCINGKSLKENLIFLNTNNSQNEYYITDIIKILKNKGLNIGCYKIKNFFEALGINDRIQLNFMNNYLKETINEKHMLNGVTIIDSANTYIEKDVIIEKDVVIYPGTILEGKTIIKEDSIIGPDARIISSSIGNGTIIEKSKVVDSIIGNNSTVGPYAYIRPGTIIKDNVKIGDFVEVKNAEIGNNCKASHMSYIGDCKISDNVNIGSGVVFVNYDGREKHFSIIEENVFIGSNSNIVAPIIIEKGAYIACGSTITDNVESGSLAIARARQVNKVNKGKDRFK